MGFGIDFHVAFSKAFNHGLATPEMQCTMHVKVLVIFSCTIRIQFDALTIYINLCKVIIRLNSLNS